MQNTTFGQKVVGKKIAIYHTGALGDLLVSTAAICEALNLFPEGEFTIIGSALWKELILPKYWPQIHFILEIKNKNFKNLVLFQANLYKNIWEEKSLEGININKFLSNYDLTIDLKSESLRFALRSFLAKVPIRVGASKSILAKPFFTHFSIRERNKEVHERDRYLDILSSINKNFINEKKVYWDEKGLPPLKEFKKTIIKSIDEKKVILINPTASIREKAWESKNFRELALKLKENSYEIYVTGSPKETDWLKEVAQDDFIIIQPQNILDLFDIVKNSLLLITNTSSMQFVAASTNTPTIALMGIASPNRWGTLGTNSLSLKNLNFKANYKSFFLSKKNVAKKNERFAYDSISVNLVLETTNRILQLIEKT